MKKSDYSDIETLIIDELIGKITDADRKRLEEWKQISTSNEQSYVHLKKAFETECDEPKYINYSILEEKIIREGFGSKKYKRTRSSRFSTFMKIAATLALLVVASYVIYQNKFINPKMEPVAPIAQEVEIVKYNPPGQKSRIVLPDNSVVWLNSDSKLTFQRGFTDSIRYLKLEGEAFFEVEKDESRPFVVQSGLIKTIAVGTSFNIRDFSHESSIKVALLSGKVRVETGSKNEDNYLIDLKEQLTFSKKAEYIKKTQLTNDWVSGWKDGIIHFERSSLDFVISTLERSYDVSIDASNYKVGNWSYTGEFDNMSLELILKRIGYSEGFDFKIQGKKIILTNKH